MVISLDFIVIQWDINGIYPLVMTNIDGLPSYKMLDLFMVMLNNQMVYIYI